MAKLFAYNVMDKHCGSWGKYFREFEIFFDFPIVKQATLVYNNHNE